MPAFRDVVILLPGITGSVLARADGKEVWGTSAGAIWRAVGSLGGSIHELALAPGGDDDGVTAPRLIPDVTVVPGLVKIDGYSRIQRELVQHLGLEVGENFFPFPYDWRLDNRRNAQRFESEAMDHLRTWRASSGNREARLVLIGHSMGGLICRYFLECLAGWRVTRTLITLGTPHRGSLNALDFLVHGVKKGIGPLGLDLTPLLRSLPSVYQLLPTYPCIDTGGAELARVAAAAEQLPHVDRERAAAARAFYTEIEQCQAANAQDPAYRERAGERDVCELEGERGAERGAENTEVDAVTGEDPTQVGEATIGVLQRAVALGGMDLAPGVAQLERRGGDAGHRAVASHVLAAIVAQQLDAGALEAR